MGWDGMDGMGWDGMGWDVWDGMEWMEGSFLAQLLAAEACAERIRACFLGTCAENSFFKSFSPRRFAELAISRKFRL